jgi:integrase
MREKLTDRLAANAAPTPGKVARYFDTDPKAPRGFLLRVTAGARVWALRYRVRDTYREREITIGEVKSWPLAEARKEGHRLRREVDTGGDPLGDREDVRSEPTVAELAERFVEEALPSRGERTAANYRAQLRDWILPAIGRRKVTAVDRDDIESLHRKITAAGKVRQANAVKSLCSVLFRQSIIWKLRVDNPATDIKNNVEHRRERFLSPAEIERLLAEIGRHRARGGHWVDSADKLELAIFTGARRGEILGMKWSQIEGLDSDATSWVLPSTVTKEGKRTGRTKRLPLSDGAVAVLRRRRGDGKVVRLRGDDNVFRTGNVKAGQNELEHDWYIIRAAAGIDDCRYHDLRHTFASVAVGQGLSLQVVGKLLGHSKAQTTERYAHLADAPLREATAKVARVVRSGRTP